MTVTDFLFAHADLAYSAPLVGLVAGALLLCVAAHFGRRSGR